MKRWSAAVIAGCVGSACAFDLGDPPRRAVGTGGVGASGSAGTSGGTGAQAGSSGVGGQNGGSGGLAAGAGGSGAGTGGSSGSASGATGGSVSGGTGGSAGSGGAPGVLLYEQDFEATSGTMCVTESPAVAIRGMELSANCDHTPALAGSQSALLEASGSIACVGCVPVGTRSVWTESLMRVDTAPTSGWAFSQFHSFDPGTPPADWGPSITGAFTVWEGGVVKIKCSDPVQGSMSVSVPLGTERRILTHYDWDTQLARVWVFDPSTSRGALGSADLVESCSSAPTASPRHFSSAAFVMNGADVAAVVQDDVRIATSSAALGYND